MQRAIVKEDRSECERDHGGGLVNRQPAANALDLIGDTPLIEVEVDGADVVAKVEFINPTGSHKDRIYLRMIEEAERRGDLRPGMTIIEGSTGNAGAACAMVGRLKGYRVMVVMPEGMSQERMKLIRALGAELLLTPGGESDQDLALEKVEEIVAADPGAYWYPAQFENPDNPLAHYESTGPELWEGSGGRVDAFVVAVGSGGTLTGAGRYLKQQNPGVKLYAVEPAECPILARGEWGSHDIQGIGDGFIPKNLDLELVDGVIVVSSEEAVEEAQRLCLDQGLVVGISTGCNLSAVRKLLRKHPEPGRVATLLFDTGQKYFTSPLFGVRADVDIPERDHSLDEDTREQLAHHGARWEIIE